MNLHTLKPIHKRPEKKRVGRGGKKGVSSGRGVGKLGASQPRIREVLKRYPKLRGYRFEGRDGFRVSVNVGVLAKKCKANEAVSPSALIEKGIVRRIKGKVPQVKILGQGDIDKALVVSGCFVSKGAREKIEKAGGTIQ